MRRTDPSLAEASAQDVDGRARAHPRAAGADGRRDRRRRGDARRASGGGGRAERVGSRARAAVVVGARSAARGADRPGDGGGPLGRRPARSRSRRTGIPGRPTDSRHPADGAGSARPQPHARRREPAHRRRTSRAAAGGRGGAHRAAGPACGAATRLLGGGGGVDRAATWLRRRPSRAVPSACSVPVSAW